MAISFTAYDQVRATACLLAVLVGLCSAPAFASEPSLTLAQAQALALARSRQLASHDSSVLASEQMAVAAAQLPDPTLILGIDNLPVSGADRYSLTDDAMTMRRVGLRQELTNADKRSARAALYERAADRARAEKNLTGAAIERDTALAWLSQYYAQKMLAIITEQLIQNRLELEAAESAYRAGRKNLAEVLAARSALGLMEDQRSQAEQKLNNARLALARWTGSAVEIALEDLPSMESVGLHSAQLDTELEQHPQITVLDKQIQLAEAEATLAQTNKKTDWSVGLAYQQRASVYGNMISVELSVPLQWDQNQRQNRELAAKQALVEQVRAERDETLREHLEQTRTMLSEWHNDRERIGRFEQELLPLANQRQAAVLAGYRGGKASLSDLLGARRDEINLRLQALQLQNDTARLWAQLNFLMPGQVLSATNKELP